jgi:hypothetical protein
MVRLQTERLFLSFQSNTVAPLQSAPRLAHSAQGRNFERAKTGLAASGYILLESIALVSDDSIVGLRIAARLINPPHPEVHFRMICQLRHAMGHNGPSHLEQKQSCSVAIRPFGGES